MNNVSFQGEHGAYSESAARKFFGNDVKTIPCKSFEDALKITEEDGSNYSVNIYHPDSFVYDKYKYNFLIIRLIWFRFYMLNAKSTDTYDRKTPIMPIV